MGRIIITYGLISGVVIIFAIIGTLAIGGDTPHSWSIWLGYLIMLAALSAILVGVKEHRDKALGGVIKFMPAFLMGLGISLVASIAYVVIWEVYLAMTHYTFMDRYAEHMLSAKRAAGVVGEAYQKAVAEADAMRKAYANPFTRMQMTFIEIFPVGFVVALISAALLRNPRFLPANPRTA